MPRDPAKIYANQHTDYHEISCGNWAEERLHEEIMKAFKAGQKHELQSVGRPKIRAVKPKRAGFTIVEVVIVVVIIGLLSAMAIPAFEKVRNTDILKAGDHDPSSLSEHDRETYFRLARERRMTVTVGQITPSGTIKGEPVNPKFQRIVVNEKTFFLIPKQNVEETVISGQTYWLVPEGP